MIEIMSWKIVHRSDWMDWFGAISWWSSFTHISIWLDRILSTWKNPIASFASFIFNFYALIRVKNNAFIIHYDKSWAIDVLLEEGNHCCIRDNHFNRKGLEGFFIPFFWCSQFIYGWVIEAFQTRIDREKTNVLKQTSQNPCYKTNTILFLMYWSISYFHWYDDKWIVATERL